MLLVIHNLPNSTRYADVKTLIQSKCGLTEVILDNLTSEGPGKRVTVGLADEGDGAILVRKINGLYVEGKQLYVEDVRKKKDSEQPFRSNQKLPLLQDSYDDYSLNENPRESNAQIQNTQNTAYQNQDAMNMMYNMAAMTGMYYMPNMQAMQPMPLAQNTYLGYDGLQQKTMPLMPQATETSAVNRPFSFNDNAGDNAVDWGSNNNRPSNRSRLPYEERRAQSPPRERSDIQDRRLSRWDETRPEARESRRRSRSPQRGWDSRDRPDIRQNRFENYRESSAPTARNIEPNIYDRAPRNMDYNSGLNFGDRNMESSISNYGAPRNKSPFDLNFEASRNTNISASNFRNQESYIEKPSPNVFGSNALQPSAARWNQTGYNQNQFEPEPFQPQRAGRDVPNQRGGNNPPPRQMAKPFYESREMSKPFYESREMSKPFEPRGFNNRGGPGPSRQFENRRDEPRGPVKRNISKRDIGAGEPQAKRFAEPMGPRPQRPPFGKVGPKVPNMPNPRVRQPEPTKKFQNPNRQQLPLEKLMKQDETWRGQAASSIAKNMTQRYQLDVPPGNRFLTHLKQSIRSRINVMLKSRIVSQFKIVEMYVKKFPRDGDQEFFLYVVNDFKQKEEKERAEAEAAAASGAVAPAKTLNADKSVPTVPAKSQAPTGKPVKQGGPAGATSKPSAKPGKPAGKAAKKPPPIPSGHLLPNFPEGDKVSYKKTKAEHKKSWHENKNELPEDLKKAVDAEVDTMCDIFMGECMNPANDAEKPVCEQIADIVSDDFRKVLRIQVSKRILNDAKNVIVRVHSASRMPPKKELEKFLLQYGCIALQKCDKVPQMMLAHLDSFENADKLIALGKTEIVAIPITFKAFQVCGPPPPAKVISIIHREKLRRFHQSQIDKSNENILQPGYVYDPKASKGGNITNGATENDKQNENSETKVEENTNVETEIGEEDETENHLSEEDKTELGIETETGEVVEVSENDDDGDDENPVETENFPDDADDIEDDNIDEDDLEDY